MFNLGRLSLKFNVVLGDCQFYRSETNLYDLSIFTLGLANGL